MADAPVLEKPVAVVHVEPMRTPGKLKAIAAAFLFAALMLLGYEAHAFAIDDDDDPTITYVVTHHRILRVAVTTATAVCALAFAFLVAHFGFGVG